MVPEAGIRILAQTVGLNAHRLQVPISDTQIEAIEDYRAGGPVLLSVSLSGLAAIPNDRIEVMCRMQNGDGTVSEEYRPRLEIREVRTMSSDYVRIEREHWLNILKELGAGQRRLVELPIPPLPEDDRHWDACLQQLTSATQRFRSGEYEQVLADCRKVVEGIAYVLADVWQLCHPQQATSFAAWTKELSNRLAKAWDSPKDGPEMLANLLSTAWSWTSPSAHYGSVIPTREEASFALSLCTDLTMFAGQLVKAHPPIRAADSQGNNAEDSHDGE